MSKSDRVATFVGSLGAAPRGDLHPCYLGWFECFNDGRYYEAHDVLEHLWLQRRDENYGFYKGLIQFAGAFVHLQKQYLRPTHAKDGRRLRPAARLFALASANLAPYLPRHLGLDVAELCALADRLRGEIEARAFAQNPWSPGTGPTIALPATPAA